MGLPIETHRKTLNKLYFAFSIIGFFIGIFLKLLPTIIGIEHNLFLEILSELGTFVALAFSIHLVYDIFIKQQERKVLLAEMKREISESLPYFITADKAFQMSGLVGYYDELPLQEIKKEFEKAKKIRILQTWTGQETNIHQYLRTALENDCYIEILLLSPISTFCKNRSEDLHRNENYTERSIETDLENFKSIIDENSKASKNLMVRVYDATPTIPMYIADNNIYLGHIWRKEFSSKTPYLKANLLLGESKTTSTVGKLAEKHFEDLWEDQKTKPYPNQLKTESA